MRKFARTISGVTPLAVMTEPISCPGECLYCPTFADSPQSYTPESPAVLRAVKCDYNARQQVEMRLGIFAGTLAAGLLAERLGLPSLFGISAVTSLAALLVLGRGRSDRTEP